MRRRRKEKKVEKIRKKPVDEKIDNIVKLELKKDLHALLEFLKDKNARVRWYAARGILRILVQFAVQNKKIDERIINALAEVLRKDKDFETRIKAVRALGCCFYSENAERALLDALKDKRKGVAIEAAYALGYLAMKRAKGDPIINTRLDAIMEVIENLKERKVRLTMGGVDLLIYSFLYGKFRKYCPKSIEDKERIDYVVRVGSSLKKVKDIREIAKILNLL